MADESSKTDAGNGSELPKDVLAPADGPRENLVVTAVKFLQNPKVRQSPLSQKKAFLESKGLTKDEIQLAIQRAGVSDDTASQQSTPLPIQDQQYSAISSSNGGLVPPALVRTSTQLTPWARTRDIATTTAVIAAVSYAVFSFIKKFVQPWLEGKSEMEARHKRLEEKIVQLQASVAESNARMAETLKSIQESLTFQMERRTQGTEAGIRLENSVLNEIKTEIVSLKGLLLNRRQFPPPPATAPVVPAWQKTTVIEEPKTETGVSRAPDALSPTENIGAGDPVANSDGNSNGHHPSELTCMPAGQTSDDSFHSSDSPDGLISLISASQSQSSSTANSDFELVKSNSSLVSEEQ